MIRLPADAAVAAVERAHSLAQASGWRLCALYLYVDTRSAPFGPEVGVHAFGYGVPPLREDRWALPSPDYISSVDIKVLSLEHKLSVGLAGVELSELDQGSLYVNDLIDYAYWSRYTATPVLWDEDLARLVRNAVAVMKTSEPGRRVIDHCSSRTRWFDSPATPADTRRLRRDFPGPIDQGFPLRRAAIAALWWKALCVAEENFPATAPAAAGEEQALLARLTAGLADRDDCSAALQRVMASGRVGRRQPELHYLNPECRDLVVREADGYFQARLHQQQPIALDDLRAAAASGSIIGPQGQVIEAGAGAAVAQGAPEAEDEEFLI